MTTETALPLAPEAPASGQQTDAEQLATQNATEGDNGATDQPEGEGDQPKKPEKSEEQKRLDRLQKGIDRKHRQVIEARMRAEALEQELSRYRTSPERPTNSPQQDDEPLTLSRAELEKMVTERAKSLAPTLSQQNAEIEHRTKVIEGLAKDLGQERFDALAEDLDEALGGLQRNGKPTPATEAIFSADDPQAVIQYLADPDNADEAEAIGRLDPVRAGRAIARLEAKLEQSKAAAKPQRSKAPEPLEASKGSGVILNMPDPSNTKAWMKWANENERRARK